jgi:hypothetical protein
VTRRPATNPPPVIRCHTGTDYSTDLIEVLGELRGFLGGEKATLLWAGLPAHRSKARQAFVGAKTATALSATLPLSRSEDDETVTAGCSRVEVVPGLVEVRWRSGSGVYADSATVTSSA